MKLLIEIMLQTIADQGFRSTGILETVQEDIVSVRNARVEVLSLSETRNLVDWVTVLKLIGELRLGTLGSFSTIILC